jgi:hypothetical protein
MFKKLRLYSEKSWIPEGKYPVILLFPFWGEAPVDPKDPDVGRFDEYKLHANELFEFSNSISDCDAVLLPYDHDFEPAVFNRTKNIALLAEEAGKKLIIFYNNDDPTTIPINNAIVFRTSIFLSEGKKNVFAFPGWSVDFLKGVKPGEFILPKQEKAIVSYCGYVDHLQEPKRTLKRIAKEIFNPIHKKEAIYGPFIRGKAIRHLLRHRGIGTNFIIREGFWGGTESDKQKVRNEYRENLLSAPYAFVTRGGGNFSYRLYEVMSCGRIPVFINCDSALPYDHIIDWKRHMVWVEESDLQNLGSTLAHFHKHISPGDFIRLQKANREVYLEYLSPYGFYKNLYRYF